VFDERGGPGPPLMFMNRNVGLLIVIAGGVMVVIGLLVYLGALSWFGRLPGDIRYEGEHTRFYFPLVSSLLASVVLSVLFYLLRRFF
jgi:H+/Cl- antiporter ClcA